MPNVASMTALAVHAAPAPKQCDRAGGKQSTTNLEFGKLVRDQAGPIESSKSGAGIVDVKNSSPSPVVSKDLNIVGVPVENQDQSVPDQSSPGGENAAKIAFGNVSPTGAQHPSLSSLSGSEQDGKAKPGFVAEVVGENFSMLTATISRGSGKPSDASPAAAESHASSKKKASDTTAEKKAETSNSAPVSGQMIVSELLPHIPVLSATKSAPEQTGAQSRPASRQLNLQDTQDSGGTDQLQPGGPDTSISSALPLEGEGVSQPALPGSEFSDDAAANGREMTVNSADHIGLSKQPSPASPQASRAASEKRTIGAGVTGSLIGGVIAPASVEASAGGVQGVGTVSSAAANLPGAGINAPGVGASSLYDRIDQGAAPVVLHSGTQHVSVGVQDPNLGWVEIQAQNTAGHVDATLVTASGQTHASLAAQLPSMAQYLQQRDVRVGTLLVHHHVSGGGSSAAGGGGSGYGSANSGTGAHHSNAGNSGGGRAAPRLSGVSAGRVGSGQGMGSGVQGGDDGAAFRPVSYISVRA